MIEIVVVQQQTHVICVMQGRDFLHQHAFNYFADEQHSSLMLYRTMQPEYKPAEYLSVVKCASNRRLISSFRTGCHGLRADTGRWADGVHLDRTGRLCLMCKSLSCVEDEQHFVFDCPAYMYVYIQPYHVTAFGPPAALLCHCRLYDFV